MNAAKEFAEGEFFDRAEELNRNETFNEVDIKDEWAEKAVIFHFTLSNFPMKNQFKRAHKIVNK